MIDLTERDIRDIRRLQRKGLRVLRPLQSRRSGRPAIWKSGVQQKLEHVWVAVQMEMLSHGNDQIKAAIDAKFAKDKRWFIDIGDDVEHVFQTAGTVKRLYYRADALRKSNPAIERQWRQTLKIGKRMRGFLFKQQLRK